MSSSPVGKDRVEHEPVGFRNAMRMNDWATYNKTRKGTLDYTRNTFRDRVVSFQGTPEQEQRDEKLYQQALRQLSKNGTQSTQSTVPIKEEIEDLENKIKWSESIIEKKQSQLTHHLQDPFASGDPFAAQKKRQMKKEIKIEKNIIDDARRDLKNALAKINTQPVQTGGYIKTSKGKRKVHTGKRGGKYIMMGGKKKYLK